jgi:hypothetical protein
MHANKNSDWKTLTVEATKILRRRWEVDIRMGVTLLSTKLIYIIFEI